MNYTQHYQLPQWVETDRIMMDDFNDMTAKLDSGLAAAAQGNCRIVTGSYTGTGEYGSAHPNTLTFDGLPLVLMVNGGWQFTALRGSAGTPSMGANNDVSHVTFSWEGNSVSWHSTGASQQLNEVNENYAYIALLSAVLS